jgi:2-polyprenyl-3-methyl-5-hydroxy-6-metoxy-1,4-benzoquinol methylase
LGERLGRRFDQIVCLEVIEHLLDDHTLIVKLASCLNPGGQLLLTTPFDEHRPLYRERLSANEDGGHVRWGYSVDQLCTLATGAGLNVVEISYVSGLVSQKLTNLQRRGATYHPILGWFLTFPLRITQPVDRALTRMVRYPYLSIAVVAQSPP